MANNTLTLYCDYQCPHCAKLHPILRSTERRLAPNAQIEYRNFPLTDIHPHAKAAALSALAARNQGKFQEMHDLLFRQEGQLETSTFYDLANQIGLDIQKFQEDIDSPELRQMLKEEFEDGLRLNVSSTPSIFINGERYEGERTEDAFVEALLSTSPDARAAS